MFKRSSCALIAVLLVTISACSSQSPADPGPVVSIIVSGHPEWPPIMYRSGASIDGAGAALVKLIFDGLDLRTSFPHTGTWDDVQLKAQSGEVDVLVAAYKTTAREGYMIYSDAYTTDPVAIYVAKGKAFAFDNWDVLAGDDHFKKAGTASQFESLPKVVTEEPFYITISKKSPFVIYMDQINQAIAKYKADGTINALIAQYKNK